MRFEKPKFPGQPLADVRIRKFVTRFTKFSLEIRKTILFFFWNILKEILEVNKRDGRKHLEDTRGYYYGDTRGYLMCIG